MTDDDGILVNNKAVLVIPASEARGRKITVNNGGKLLIYPDDADLPEINDALRQHALERGERVR